MEEKKSMSSALTVAVAQSFCVPGDVAGNVDRMEPLIRQAAGGGARLILFAESGLTGCEAAERTWKRAVVLGDDTCCRLHRLARDCGMVIAAGFIERDGNVHHNSHGVFYPDGTLVVQRKARITQVEQPIPNMQGGPEERTVFEVDGVKCALSICADTGIEDLLNKLARAGVQLHLVPTAGCSAGRSLGFAEAELDDPRRLDEYLVKAESVVFSRDAIRWCRQHRLAMACCNQMADDGKTYFHCGHSMLVDSTGELVGLIPGSFVFEHLRPRVIWGDVHPQVPREVPAKPPCV